MKTITSESPAADGDKVDWLEVVRNNVANLKFGSVQITVHEGLEFADDGPGKVLFHG